jgi:hypothetical protein
MTNHHYELAAMHARPIVAPGRECLNKKINLFHARPPNRTAVPTVVMVHNQRI